MSHIGNHSRLIILFYAALNSFRGKRNRKVNPLYNEALSLLQIAMELSPRNWRSKLFLLEAEFNSFEGNDSDAKASYAAAITAARSSRYIHEHGLACELAGFHYERIGALTSARDFFVRAKECYSQWGSEMKVDSINRQLERLLLRES